MKALDGKKNSHNLSFSFSIERGCVCPQTGQVCSFPNPFLHAHSLILFCIVLCGVFGSVPFRRASLACLGCPCCGWPLPVSFSCGFLPWRCRAPPLCCCSLVLVWLLSPFLSDLAAWVLAVWPSLSWLPPVPPPLVVFWCFLVQSVVLVPPSGFLVVLYLQRSGCHTFGIACRGYFFRSPFGSRLYRLKLIKPLYQRVVDLGSGGARSCLLTLWGVLVSLRFEPPCAHPGHTTNRL